MSSAVEQLRARLAQIADLGRARALLSWDQWTVMPRAGGPARADQLATLTGVRHGLATDDEIGRLLDAAAKEVEGLPYDSDDASLVRIARRDWERARRVPAELRAEIARANSISEEAWARAREASDFDAFLPHLRRNLELARREAECLLGWEGLDNHYDALLDSYEPGMRAAALAPVLAELREGLAPICADLPAGDPAREPSCLNGRFPVAAQRELMALIAQELPLPEAGWRLDDTVHPFATTIGPRDVRITTRYDERYLGTAIWSVIHEIGHALYGSGLPEHLFRSPLYRSPSLGFGESQSRLWENWVGRSRAYVRRLREHLARTFPQAFEGVSADELFRAANRHRRSLIRVEADEVTYNLHIAIRFELERELVAGELDPADLPRAWNERVEAYLGLEVPDDASGALQDIHWAGGSFGYFPTYSVGNLIAAQLYEQAQAELGDLDARIEAGDFVALHDWLRERVYRHGGRFSSPEMIERTVGELRAEPLLAHLRRRLAEAQEG